MKKAIRGTSLTVKAFFLLMGLSVVGLAILGWRLSYGYISLTPIAPYIEAAISDENQGIRISFEEVRLTWRPAHENPAGHASLELRLTELKMRDDRGNMIASLPEGGMQISGLALMRGILAPTVVDLSGLSLHYMLDEAIWQTEGETDIAELFQNIILELQKSEDLFARLFRQMLLPPDRTKAEGYLRTVSIGHANLFLEDELTRQTWSFPDTLLQLDRIPDGVELTLDGRAVIAVPDTDAADKKITIPTVLTVDQNRQSQMTRIRWQFEGVNPWAVAGKIPALSMLKIVDGPISGFIEVFMGKEFIPESLLFDFGGGSGEVNYKELFPQSVPFDEFVVSGRYERTAQRLQLDNIYLAFGESRIEGNGLVLGDIKAPDVSLLLRLNKINVQTLPSYFPYTRATRGAYNWITQNMDAGVVRDGDVTLRLTPQMWESGIFPDDALDFRFKLDNVTAHYLRPMPPITEGRGYARLGLDEFSLILDAGRINDLTLGESKVLFSQIGQRNKGLADITVNLSGELEEILRVIDYKPLEYPKKFGITPDDVGGRGQATLILAFPLLKKISLDDVDFKLKATVDDFAYPSLTESFSLGDGTLTLQATRSDLFAKGPVSINGVPMQLSWRENFDGRENWTTQYRIRGTVAPEQWGSLHMPFEGYIHDPAELSVALDGRRGLPEIGNGKLDFSGASASFPQLGWVKEKGGSADVVFDLVFSPEEVRTNNIALRAAGLEADASLVIDRHGLASLELPRLFMAKNLFSLSLRRGNDAIYDVYVQAKEFDTLPLLTSLFSPEVENSNSKTSTTTLADMRLHAQADILYADDGMEMSQAVGRGTYLNGVWTEAALSGRWGTDKTISLSLTPQATGQQQLKINSNDAGQVMRGLGIYASGVDGTLDIEANVRQFEGRSTMGGKVKIDKFRVINSPSFASMLTDRSMERISDTLEREGISFDKLRADFRFFDGILEIDKARVYGAQLGLTLNGQVDQRYDELNLKGTLVPAYGLNSLLGNVPLIGDLLMGGKGKGLFAVNFRVRGSVNKPDVIVNPLSAIAPGFLREVFGVFDSDPKTKREKEQKGQQIEQHRGANTPVHPPQEQKQGEQGTEGKTPLSPAFLPEDITIQSLPPR